MPTPSLTLDIVPFVLVATSLISAFCLTVTTGLRRGPPHLRYWAFGGVLVSLSTLLIVLRGYVPDLLSILIGNLGIIAGYAMLSAGTHLYHGRPARLDLMLGLLFGAAFAGLYGLGVDLDGRVIGISVPIIGFSVLMLIEFARPEQRPISLPARLAIAACAINGMLSLLRLLLAAWPTPLPVPSTMVHIAVLSFGIVAIVGLAVILATLSAPLALRRTTPLPPERQPDLPAAPAPEPHWVLATQRRALVLPTGAELRLTGNEFLLLQQLRDTATAPVARETLNAAIGRPAINPKDRSIDILISRLRRKCGEAGADLPVVSIRGRGYVFHGELNEA